MPSFAVPIIMSVFKKNRPRVNKKSRLNARSSEMRCKRNKNKRGSENLII